MLLQKKREAKMDKTGKKRKKYRVKKRVWFACILMAGTVFVLGWAFLQIKGCGGRTKGRMAGAGISFLLSEEPDSRKEGRGEETEQEDPLRQETITQAERLAAAYDYDAAITLLGTIEGYDSDSEIQEKIRSCEAAREACVPVNMEEVTHVFYHTLVVDPNRAFANQDKDPQAVGNNQWMTTISEFEKITQEMYDRGYVIVGIHDLIQTVTDENGNVTYQPAQIMLPPGKRAYVLSQDDLCYYHSYDNYGYAARMLIGPDGRPTCEYIEEDGTHRTGPYDVVPLLDAFIEAHPDASYRGAKGIIALTGYNGILGYRTDNSYLDINGNLNEDKKQWLREHPDFDIEQERAGAKQVADALKADGWEFASHTWGHIRIGDASLERLMGDTQKWRENVEPIVGPVDTIIFAHGQDLGEWGAYDEGNAKYRYLREQGYSIFCNVDSNLYRTWFGKDYMRQGRRDLDGLRIYLNAIGEEDNVGDLFDAKEVIDPLRPPVPKAH